MVLAHGSADIGRLSQGIFARLHDVLLDGFVIHGDGVAPHHMRELYCRIEACMMSRITPAFAAIAVALIENRTGGSGTIGTEIGAKSSPDDFTVLDFGAKSA